MLLSLSAQPLWKSKLVNLTFTPAHEQTTDFVFFFLQQKVIRMHSKIDDFRVTSCNRNSKRLGRNVTDTQALALFNKQLGSICR